MRIWLPCGNCQAVGRRSKTNSSGLAGRDWLKPALQVVAPWQTEIIERGYTQKAMGGSELALRDVGRIAFRIDLFQIGKHIQV